MIDFMDRVQDRGVVLSAELPPDLRERRQGQFLREIHGDLPRVGHAAAVVLGFQLRQAQAKLLANHPLDVFDGDSPLLLVHQIFQDLLRHGQRYFSPGQRRIGNQPHQCALEVANA